MILRCLFLSPVLIAFGLGSFFFVPRRAIYSAMMAIGWALSTSWWGCIYHHRGMRACNAFRRWIHRRRLAVDLFWLWRARGVLLKLRSRRDWLVWVNPVKLGGQ